MELACDEEEVVGCLGSLPQVLLDGQNEIPAGVLIEWLVNSRYRGKKVGLALGQRALARYPIAIGMGSTPLAYKIWCSLGLVDHGFNVTARRILHPWRWAKHAGRGNLLSKVGWSGLQYLRFLGSSVKRETDHLEVTLAEPGAIDHDLIDFSHQLAKTHVCTLRNAIRWEWLLMKSPLYSGHVYRVGRQGAVLGYAGVVIATRSGRKVATIADVSVRRIEDAAPVIGAIALLIEESKVDGITFTVSKEVADQVIRDYGFVAIESPPMSVLVKSGFEYLLERPWFMTRAENLGIVGGIDPVGRSHKGSLK